jgi:hypothetical protein
LSLLVVWAAASRRPKPPERFHTLLAPERRGRAADAGARPAVRRRAAGARAAAGRPCAMGRAPVRRHAAACSSRTAGPRRCPTSARRAGRAASPPLGARRRARRRPAAGGGAGACASTCSASSRSPGREARLEAAWSRVAAARRATEASTLVCRSVWSRRWRRRASTALAAGHRRNRRKLADAIGSAPRDPGSRVQYPRWTAGSADVRGSVRLSARRASTCRRGGCASTGSPAASS